MQKVKLSTSKLRQDAGVTAFIAEVLNYVSVNGVEAGTVFNGVPGHPRYSASKQTLQVNAHTDDIIKVTWTEKGETYTINPSKYMGRTGTDTTAPATPSPTQTAAPSAGAGLEVLNSLFAQQQQLGYERAKAELSAKIDALQAQLKELEGKGTGTVINVTIDNRKTTTKTEKVLDPHFKFILRLLADGRNVYLYGPAGSGKNVICEELAKALGVDFYYQNTLVTPFDVTGYKNAQGEYEETPFYQAWTKGGIFFADELDNSRAEAIIALNAALANGYYTFPGKGLVKKHPDFRCVAAGNTNGQGATDEYCGRYQMDESSRDRFAFVRIDYNEEIERSIVGDKTDILTFVHALREVCAKEDIKCICGYRGIKALTDYYDEDTRTVLDTFVLKGMDKHDIKQIATHISLICNNKYTKAIL